jgi:hypothetical protein
MSYKNEGPIQGIVGVMNVNGANYLGVISASQVVGTLNKAKINKVSQVKIFPFKVCIESRNF